MVSQCFEHMAKIVQSASGSTRICRASHGLPTFPCCLLSWPNIYGNSIWPQPTIPVVITLIPVKGRYFIEDPNLIIIAIA